MNKKKQKILFISAIFLLIVFGMFQNTYKKSELEEFGEEVFGIIIDFKFVHKSTYKIIYKYNVDDKDYFGERRTSYFECDNGNKGCIGNEFKIIYSKKNPKTNEIDLGKYNKYKKKNPSL